MGKTNPMSSLDEFLFFYRQYFAVDGLVGSFCCSFPPDGFKIAAVQILGK